MTTADHHLTHDALVTALRTAGCVFAEEEADLLLAEAPDEAALVAMLEQRVAGRPLEQVLGWAEFCGLRIAVERGVFVPRRRTELLVREAAAVSGAGDVVVDLCCGSGAIGAALAATVPGGVELHATDIDPRAVACASRNLERFGGRVHEGDLEAPLPRELRGRVDTMVACPPYVPTDAVRLMPPEAREHEPRSALDGGADGLDLVRRIAVVAATWLRPGGHVLVESSDPQAEEATAAFTGVGLGTRVATDEDLGATVVVGRRP